MNPTKTGSNGGTATLTLSADARDVLSEHVSNGGGPPLAPTEHIVVTIGGVTVLDMTYDQRWVAVNLQVTPSFIGRDGGWPDEFYAAADTSTGSEFAGTGNQLMNLEMSAEARESHEKPLKPRKRQFPSSPVPWPGSGGGGHG